MSVFNYSKGKRQLYEIVRSNTVTMSVCVIVIIGIIFMAGKMLDIDMFHLLFTTFVGQVVLTVTVGCILVFVKKLIEVSG